VTYRSYLRWALPLILLTVLASCSRLRNTAATHDTGKAAPDFTLKDSTGATIKLSDYRGRVVLLNFWATWCEPCKVEIPWFISFQQKFKNQDFAVLGVSMDDDGWESVKPYLAKSKINYQVVVGNDDISKLFGEIDALPTTFVIDRGGHIANSHMGLVSKLTYEEEIGTLLKQPRTEPKRVGALFPSLGTTFAFLRGQ
jgi:peroxiredoxin